MRPNFSKFLGMMCLMLFSLFASTIEVEAQQTRPKIAQMELAPGEDYIILTDVNGTQTYVALDSAFIEHSVRNLTYEDDSLCFEVYNAFLDELITTECVFVPEGEEAKNWYTTVYDDPSTMISIPVPLPDDSEEYHLIVSFNGLVLVEGFGRDYIVAPIESGQLQIYPEPWTYLLLEGSTLKVELRY